MLENSQHHAIYVGLTQNSGERLLSALPDDCKSRAMAIGISKIGSHSSTDADYILAPQVALKAANDLDKLLLVFDDVLLCKFKEKLVYELAS